MKNKIFVGIGFSLWLVVLAVSFVPLVVLAVWCRVFGYHISYTFNFDKVAVRASDVI